MVNLDYGTEEASNIAGGDIDTDYYVSNNSNLIIDVNFQCKSLILGRHSSGSESAGYLDLQADWTITFGVGLVIGTFGNGHLWLYPNGSGVRDSPTDSPDAESPVIFTRNVANFLTIRNKGGNSIWTAKYYILIQPNMLFSVYSESVDPTVNNRVILTDFGEVIASSPTPRPVNLSVQARRGAVSRVEHIGYGPEEATLSCIMDIEDYGGVIKNIKNLLYTSGNKYFIVTDTDILIDWIFNGDEIATRVWETETTRMRFNLTFMESIL